MSADSTNATIAFSRRKIISPRTWQIVFAVTAVFAAASMWSLARTYAATLLVLHACDSLFNAMVSPIFFLAAGGLASALLGDRNWYLPSWLQWLPRLEPESEPASEPRPELPAAPLV